MSALPALTPVQPIAELSSAPRLRLVDDGDQPVESGAMALRDQLELELLSERDRPVRGSPARGVAIGLGISAILWWAIISGVSVALHH